MLVQSYTPGPVGGAELQAERLACKLACMGYSIQVMTNPVSRSQPWIDSSDKFSFAPTEEVRYCTEEGPSLSGKAVYIHRVPFAMAYQFTEGYADTFRYLVKNRDSYDILHCHMAFGHAVVATIVARIFGKRCVIKFACTGEIGELGVIKKFKGYSQALHVLHRAHAVIAISYEMVDELLAHGFSREQIIYIPNGVDTTGFQPYRQAIQRKKLRFVLIGRRTPQKGVDLLLNAVRSLKSLGLRESFEVQLYGIDYADYDYRSMASDLGVDDCVSFFPFHNDISSVYRQADGFLLPSRGEGLSNSLLEAMATGLPVIASRVSGTVDSARIV